MGKDKVVIDAELFAIHRGMKVFLKRQETEAAYTIFSDSTGAIEQVCADRAGPGQASARAVIELEGLLVEKGCSVTIRWTPAHKGVEGKEVADSYAGWAAGSHCGLVDQAYF